MSCEILFAEAGTAVEIKFSDGLTANFEECWLRDHCRCQSCYHPDTFQRANHILDIPEVSVFHLNFDKHALQVTWDDLHESVYDAEFLHKYEYKNWSQGKVLKPELWHGDMSTKVADVNVDDFINTTSGAVKVFKSLLKYGVVLITGVEPTLQATEVVCKALGGVQRTLFGDMWQFSTKADHADTAYTNLPLALHHDNTYFTEAAGLQILHCVEHTGGGGGETILSDGFFAAQKFKENCPDDFDFLKSFDVEAEYIEDGHHHKFSAPIIRVDEKTGDFIQIRFNAYDRSAMGFSSGEECRAYYKALKNFAGLIEDEDARWQFKLKPGTALAFDNFRVLHGRSGFTGTRVLCGSYVARSDWLDRARVLKLIQ